MHTTYSANVTTQFRYCSAGSQYDFNVFELEV